MVATGVGMDARRRYRRLAAGGLVALLVGVVLLAGACGGVRQSDEAGEASASQPAASGDAEGAILDTMRRFIEGDPLDRCAASTDRLLAFIYAEGRAGCEAQQTPGEELRGYELVSRGAGRAEVEYTTEVDPDTLLAAGLVRRGDEWLVDTFAIADGS